MTFQRAAVDEPVFEVDRPRHDDNFPSIRRDKEVRKRTLEWSEIRLVPGMSAVLSPCGEGYEPEGMVGGHIVKREMNLYPRVMREKALPDGPNADEETARCLVCEWPERRVVMSAYSSSDDTTLCFACLREVTKPPNDVCLLCKEVIPAPVSYTHLTLPTICSV